MDGEALRSCFEAGCIAAGTGVCFLRWAVSLVAWLTGELLRRAEARVGWWVVWGHVKK